MDFKNDGHWHYVMIDQDGNHYWNWMGYNKIKPIDFYEALDAFCNEAEEINPDMPRAKWEVALLTKAKMPLLKRLFIIIH